MRVDDPSLLEIGDRVQRQRNGPIWRVKAIRRAAVAGGYEVGVWMRKKGWRVFPFAGLILVERGPSAPTPKPQPHLRDEASQEGT